MKGVYSAVFSPKENGTGYYCRVPDLPGCITTGRDEAECLDLIQDAANLWLSDIEKDGHAIPSATPLADIPHEPGDICTLVAVDTDKYRRENDSRAVRKNVSLPAWMAYQAEQRGINCSQILQDALRQVLA